MTSKKNTKNQMPDTPEQNPILQTPNLAPSSIPQAPQVNPQAPQPDPVSPNSTPINPELQNVQINQKPAEVPQGPSTAVPTVAAPTPVIPNQQVPGQKLGKEKRNPAEDKKRFLIGCFGGFLGLFVVFIILMVFVLSRSGVDNAVLQAFGLDPGNLRQFLLGVVGISFGLVSLILLVMTAVGIFRLSGAKKEDKIRRQSGIRLSLFSFISLLVTISLWLFLFNFINNLSLQAQAVPAEITIVNPTDVNNLEAPVEITFSVLNVVNNLESSNLIIERMEWDLDGDGTYETNVQNPEIVQLYTRRGFYNVSLRAFIQGEQEPRVYQKGVNVQQATFRATPSTGSAPLRVQFDASDLIPENTRIQRFDWDFDGDGIYDVEDSDAEQAEYTFTQIGDYEVHLRLLNAQNNVENYYRTVQVGTSSQPLIEARIEATPGLEIAPGQQIQFDAGQSTSLKGALTSYVWNFGDGSPLEMGRSVTHTYAQAGVFNVELALEDDLGNQETEQVEVIVDVNPSAPSGVITTTPAFDSEANQLTGDAPFKVNFDASQSTDRDDDIVDYGWDFDGDGEVDKKGESAEYTFAQPGQFTAVLLLEDAQGQTSQTQLLVEVTEPPLLAVIDAEPQEGTPPLVVNFDGSASRAFNGNIVSYEWNFGDGSAPTITGATITHQYTRVGNFTATLKVTSETGEVAQVDYPIFIRETPLEACFTPSRRQGPAPLGVKFDVQCSTGTIASYEWDFGDGTKASSFNPNHEFQSPGVYTVTLTISDSKNNISTFTDVVTAEGEL